MARAFGLDISKYQSSQDGSKKMNFNAVRDYREKVSFIAARAGVSWGYQDPMFPFFWQEMMRIGVCRMAYFVVYFGESAITQMDALFKTLEGKANWKYDRIALDLEVEGINPAARITNTTLRCLEICKTRTGRYPIIYSRASWINQFVQVKNLPKVDWWLAHYRKTAPAPLFTAEHPGPPDLPAGVSNYLIHQTGDKCKGIGTASYYMDYNRWNGDHAAVLAYFGNPRLNEEYLDTGRVLFKARCMRNNLPKRSGPAASYAAVGQIALGSIVSVYEVVNNWFRISPQAQVWCSGSAQNMQQLTLEDDLNRSLFQARCIVSALYKRSGPGRDYIPRGNLVRGEVVNVFEELNGWYRIDLREQIWCSGDDHYMEVI